MGAVKGGTLTVDQAFHKFYVCDACGTECYFCVTNTWRGLPCPKRCPYGDDGEIKVNWRPIEESNDESPAEPR